MNLALRFAIFIPTLFISPLAAQNLDIAKPYELHLVLDISKHRLLTPVFKEQVKRELQDGLRTAFGDMVRVTVLDKHEKLDDVRKRGLGETLDSWRELTEVKTQFVLIDFVEGQYEVQTRQHDGLTGLSSPVIRRERITDRLFVARLATFLIHRDFGLVGQITDHSDPKKLKVAIKGGTLGAPLSRWLKKGEVLKFAPITASGSPKRVDDTYLQVEEVDDKGGCVCRFYNRFQKPFSQGVTFRCLHIHTLQAPLRVQLIQSDAEAKTRIPVENMRAIIRRFGFEGEDATRIVKSSERDGFLSTEKDLTQGTFNRLVFLTLEQDKRQFLVPVALVDDRPVIVRVPVRQTAQSLLHVRRELWDQQAFEAGLVQKDLFKELKELESKPNLREKALKRAKEGREQSQGILKQLENDREDLQKSAQSGGEKIDLSIGNQWIAYLEKGNTQLDSYIKDQEKILAEEKDPRRLEYQGLRQQARLEEARGEFTKALELYDKAIKFGFDDAQLKKDYESLKTRWEPKNEDHRKMRLWLDAVFATADLLKMPGIVKEARDAFALLRKENDLLGSQKMSQLLLAHAGKLKEQRDGLMPDVNEEDRKALEVIIELTGELRKLGLDLQAFIGK